MHCWAIPLLLTKVNRLTLKDLELGPTNRQLVTSASSCAQGELRYPSDAHWPHKTACHRIVAKDTVKHKNKNNKNNNDNEAISYQSLLVDCQHCIIIMEDGTGYGTIHEGQVIDVRHSDRSGLLSTKALYVRPDVIRLRRALDTSSCIVQGAPGVGKSIAVWSWLLAKVKKLPANRKVLWCHFRQVGAPTNNQRCHQYQCRKHGF